MVAYNVRLVLLCRTVLKYASVTYIYFSFISSQTLIGSPAEVYSFGTIVLYQTLGTGVGTIIGFIFYLPVFKQSNVISVFQVSAFLSALNSSSVG